VAKAALSIAPAGPISRSGLWLIGGTLVLAIGVLAWAFQEEPAGKSTVTRPRSVSAGRASGSSTAVRVRSQPAGVRIARAPSLAGYGPLLQRNVFRPLVVPESAKRPAARRSASTGMFGTATGGGLAGGTSGPTDTWRGWKFNGVAHLDRKTYALMDQTGKRQSRFVQPGDKLEDAVVARVEQDEVTLREAAGSIIRVQRVDAMAELLRPTRAAPRAPQQPAAPSTAPPATPTPPGGRPNPVATTPNSEGLRLAPAATGVEERAAFQVERQDARRARRQERLREAGRSGAGDASAVSED
jgi:hypothetical protein